MAISKRDELKLLAKLFGKLSQGFEMDEIANDMGISVDDVKSLKNKLLEMKATELKDKPIEHIYVEYMINQLININDLTKFIATYRGDPKQANASVGAVRTRSEIWDKIITKGQDCGVIQKAPNRTETIFGVIVADLSDKDLDKLLKTKMKELNKLMEAKPADILQLPGPDQIYSGPEAIIDANFKEVEKENKKEKQLKKKKKKKKKRKVKKIEIGD